jgi:glycosyltransferase involved in cell wall biosynthesis
MIGIVTISFNQSAFIKEAIESVLVASKGVKIKYVVVDAGSTDATASILERYKNHIDVLVQEPDQGPADGLNKGFSYCTDCDILGYINADDRLHPDSLNWVQRVMDRCPSVDVLLGAIAIIDEYGRVSRRARVSDHFDVRRYAAGACNVFQQGTFFRRKAFERTNGFNVQNRTCWDGELVVDMALAGASFMRTRKILGDFRIYPTSITGSKKFINQYVRDRRRIADKIYATGIGRPSAMARMVLQGFHRFNPMRQVSYLLAH